MSTHNSDLQAAVDATSIGKDTGETDDLAGYLREQLAEREIETADDAWIAQVVAGIESNPNYLIESEPNDFKTS